MLSIYLVIFSIVSIYILIESVILSRRLSQIPIRILVNGTRGKSTTVILLHRLLHKKGYRVYAKTTGDEPVIYNPDGSKTILKRFGPASILENVYLLFNWGKFKPDAVVMECMAIQPEIQQTLAKFILKPTDIIITNIFPDHQEVMGHKLTENVRTIARCIHHASTVFCSEETDALLESADVQIQVRTICKKQECTLNLPNIPPEILDDSWSLIKNTAAYLEIDSSDTINCFTELWESLNDKIKYHVPGKNIIFWDLYSVNDVHSAHQFISHLIERYSDSAKIIFNLNCREDRPLRTRNFVCLINEHLPNSEIWLTGSGRRLAKRLFQKAKFSINRVQIFSEKDLIEILHTGLAEPGMIFGIANKRGTDKILSTFGKICTSHTGN